MYPEPIMNDNDRDGRISKPWVASGEEVPGAGRRGGSENSRPSPKGERAGEFKRRFCTASSDLSH
jgi:hypothetical protein